MSLATEKTIQLALRNLEVLGVKFLAILPNGEVHTVGDVQAILAGPPKKRMKRTPTKDFRYDFRDLRYADIMKDMAAGDNHVFTIPSDKPYTGKDLKKVLSGRGFTLWGKDNYLIQWEEGSNDVEVLRLA